MPWEEWMERSGLSLKRMAEMLGYDKTTLWHTLKDGKYRKRLSRKFWGKVGALIRWKVKPLVHRLEGEGMRTFRCPHCKVFFRLKVKARGSLVVEPVGWDGNETAEGLSKGMGKQKAMGKESRKDGKTASRWKGKRAVRRSGAKR